MHYCAYLLLAHHLLLCISRCCQVGHAESRTTCQLCEMSLWVSFIADLRCRRIQQVGITTTWPRIRPRHDNTDTIAAIFTTLQLEQFWAVTVYSFGLRAYKNKLNSKEENSNEFKPSLIVITCIGEVAGSGFATLCIEAVFCVFSCFCHSCKIAIFMNLSFTDTRGYSRCILGLSVLTSRT